MTPRLVEHLSHGGWLARLVAVLVGLLSVTAFAPFGAFWALPILLAVVFHLTQGLTPRRAAWIGLGYGLGQYSFGIAWIVVGLAGAGGAPVPLAVAMLVGLVVLLSLFMALTLWLTNRFFPPAGALRNLLALPALWTVVEWLRSWVFTGFPWLSLGYSQIDSPLVGLGPIFGVFGISWAVALSAGLLTWAMARGRRLPLGIAGLAVVWAGAWGLGQIPWTHAFGDIQNVALVQGNVSQYTKWSEARANKAVDRYVKLSRRYWATDLIVWPETAIPNYYHEVKPQLDELAEELKLHDTTLITGIMTADFDTEDVYNSSVSLGAGEGVYSKRHLVPYGEFFPVPEFVRRWMAANGMPYTDLTSGQSNQDPTTAKDVSLGMSICYEDIFGDLLAGDAPPASILVNISDDAWFGRSIGPEQHFEIARMRAVEVGRPLLRSDNSAVTGIVGADGRVIKRAPGHEETVLTGEVRQYKGRTPFSHWGSWPIAGLGLVLILGSWLLGRLTRRHRGKN